MDENKTTGMDERTLFISKAIGVTFVIAGIYGLYMAYKIYNRK